MNTKESITKAYDRAAREYATKFWNELESKPFDRMLLNWFAAQIPSGETILEIGAGPGEVSGLLQELGAECLATDISEQMMESGKRYFPQVRFEVQDFLDLQYENGSFYGVVGFYAIVNLVMEEVKTLLQEVKRVLKREGIFLFSFHVFEGEEKAEIKNFLDQSGSDLTFYYFKVEAVKELVENVGYQVLDILIRYPYKDVEYPSKRAYFIVKKP